MVRPLLLASDDPQLPGVVERDLRSKYAVRDRMPRAGESTLDVPDGFGAHPASLFSCPGRARSRVGRHAGA
jgi:hypothetical protein